MYSMEVLKFLERFVLEGLRNVQNLNSMFIFCML